MQEQINAHLFVLYSVWLILGKKCQDYSLQDHLSDVSLPDNLAQFSWDNESREMYLVVLLICPVRSQQ